MPNGAITRQNTAEVRATRKTTKPTCDCTRSRTESGVAIIEK